MADPNLAPSETAEPRSARELYSSEPWQIRTSSLLLGCRHAARRLSASPRARRPTVRPLRGTVPALQYKVHADTRVTYHDAAGAVEEGEDYGALTAEAFGKFWCQALDPANGLFERSPSDREAHGRMLPAPPPADPAAAEAHLERLRQLGHILLKCLVWEHPTGPQLVRAQLSNRTFRVVVALGVAVTRTSPRWRTHAAAGDLCLQPPAR